VVVRLRGVLVTGAATTPESALLPASIAVRWPAGDDGEIAVDVVDDAGAVYDTTGESYVLTVRRRRRDDQPVICRAGTPGADGRVTFELEEADTADLEPGEYRYDVQRIDEGARAQVVPAAPFYVAESIGRDNDTPT
jgi:hypothetical protein